MKRMVTLYYDDNVGELARVEWSDSFVAETSTMRLDVLQDAIRTMEGLYKATYVGLYGDEAQL